MYYLSTTSKFLFPARRQHFNIIISICSFWGDMHTEATAKQLSGVWFFLFFMSILLWNRHNGPGGKDIGYGIVVNATLDKLGFLEVFFHYVSSSGNAEGIGRERKGWDGWMEQPLGSFLLSLYGFFPFGCGYDGSHFLFFDTLLPPLSCSTDWIFSSACLPRLFFWANPYRDDITSL